MPHSDLLAEIDAAERQLQAAWADRNGPAALELRAKISRLWERRRAELAGRLSSPGRNLSQWSWQQSTTARRASR